MIADANVGGCGQAVEETALVLCVRRTLEMFLNDHPELEEVGVEIVPEELTPDPLAITLVVAGHEFTLKLTAPSFAP
ncbi:hypothetical protein [Sphingomonas koreensis]|nr:hypothetical protein [Sphingomonas koreensis]RSU21229.1 hypothetical protein CA224_06925 [Sphingomonas koreensis]RSU32206.1 hypothetical protein CA225_02560 [Sphingomonas koreensis]RSU35700.1 hypothetical protein BRX39_08730 [Sphingomonas koreensis]RSU49871.1 hypothetical protein CA221_12350 [Sphingomonas koreensis]RSU83466.1 hypothetical protein CA253_21205 [Sphingomonas koreensis]